MERGDRTREDRLPVHVRRYVERELEDFPFNELAVSRFEEMVRDVTLETPIRPEGGGRTEGMVGDPTGRKAVRLAILRDQYEAKLAKVRAIRETMALLTEEEQKIVRFRYFDRTLTHDGVMVELGLSRGAYFQRLNRILRRFAISFGLL